MSDRRWKGLSWLFVMVLATSGLVLFEGVPPVGASEEHEHVRELRHAGEIVPLAELMERGDLSGMRVLEAELEREGGRLVYELELLDGSGRIHKRYFDAADGTPVGRKGD